MTDSYSKVLMTF